MTSQTPSDAVSFLADTINFCAGAFTTKLAELQKEYEGNNFSIRGSVILDVPERNQCVLVLSVDLDVSSNSKLNTVLTHQTTQATLRHTQLSGGTNSVRISIRADRKTKDDFFPFDKVLFLEELRDLFIAARTDADRLCTTYALMEKMYKPW